MKVVAADGSGDYTTVQAAFDAVPDFYTGTWKIYVKPGSYYEKLLDRNKTNVVLIGDDPDSTVLWYDDYADIAGGTSKSYSVAIDVDDFTAANITFQNTVVNDGSHNNQQAVALRTNGDRQAYYNCKLLGYQDTYYAWGGRKIGRIYFKDCYVEGSVDFIFGRDAVLFDNCEIHINRHGGSLTAASTEASTNFGLVFSNCTISADSIGFNGTPITSFILGRPWQAAPRTTYLNCYEPAAVAPAGWQTWNVSPALYAEYNCYGPGSDFSNRISIGRQLTAQEAADYTVENIFAKTTDPSFGYDWTPPEVPTAIGDNGNSRSLIPEDYKLGQNYPNPFNPSTTIEFQMPRAGKVKLLLYNTLAQVVKTLVNSNYKAGYHKVLFDASNFASGVYFYRLEADPYSKVKKNGLFEIRFIVNAEPEIVRLS
ncbi:pectinesterase family protein [Calditrichota bacterium]